jgi:hypothetical protein
MNQQPGEAELYPDAETGMLGCVQEALVRLQRSRHQCTRCASVLNAQEASGEV